jgi:predicted nucleotidyltransferase
MYKLKFTRLQNSILRLLYVRVGKSLNKREIAIQSKVSPTAVAKALQLLEKEKLVNVEKKTAMNLTEVSLNRDNPKAIYFKRIENLKLIYECGLLLFLEEQFPACPIILFGSYARGEDTIKSDIDIAIMNAKQKELNIHKFEKLLERHINIQTYQNFNKIHKELRTNIINGVTLSGVLEL